MVKTGNSVNSHYESDRLIHTNEPIAYSGNYKYGGMLISENVDKRQTSRRKR